MESRSGNDDSPRAAEQLSRQILRYQLPALHNVYHSHTGRFMGAMGNVSCNGFMLVCPLPVGLGVEYALQLYLPATVDDPPTTLTFQAMSRWYRQSLTPGHYAVGFCSVDSTPMFAYLAAALRHYFTFVRPRDA